MSAFHFCCLVPQDACVGEPEWRKKLDRLNHRYTLANVAFQQPGELPRQMMILQANLITFKE